MMYGQGISRESNVLDVAVNLEIIKKGGSWFSYGEDRLGQGRENVKQYMIENPDFTDMIENQIRETFGFKGTPLRFIIRERKEKDQ